MSPSLKGNKTTITGIISLVALVLNAAVALFDDDPATKPDWNAIGIGATAIGLMFSRDNDTTSEEAGAR